MEIKLSPQSEQYLEPQDIVALLAQTMPKITIDWIRGNELVEEKRQQLLMKNVPPVILLSHSLLTNNTAYLEINFPEFPEHFVHLIVVPYSGFILRSSDPNNEALLHYASDRISHVLGYESYIT